MHIRHLYYNNSVRTAMSKCNHLYNMYLSATSLFTKKPIIFSVTLEDYPNGDKTYTCHFTDNHHTYLAKANENEGKHFSKIIQDLAYDCDDDTLTVAQLTELDPYNQLQRTKHLAIHSIYPLSIDLKPPQYPR